MEVVQPRLFASDEELTVVIAINMRGPHAVSWSVTIRDVLEDRDVAIYVGPTFETPTGMATAGAVATGKAKKIYKDLVSPF